MKASINNIALAIYESSADSTDHSAISKYALEFLVRRNLLGKSGAILEKLEEIVDINEGIVRAIVTSKHDLTPAEISDIKKILKDRYKAKTVEVKETIDPRIIGGLKIQIGDEVIDMSLRKRLNKLENYLMHS